MLARLVDSPVASPGECKSCSAGSLSDRKWWLDTGTWEEFYGRVYYCNICMTEIAELCGFLGPARRQALETKVEEANAKVRELEESLTALTTLGINVGSLSEFVSSHYVSLEGTTDNLDKLLERAAIAAQQIDEQGPVDVPNPKSGPKPKLALS